MHPRLAGVTICCTPRVWPFLVLHSCPMPVGSTCTGTVLYKGEIRGEVTDGHLPGICPAQGTIK